MRPEPLDTEVPQAVKSRKKRNALLEFLGALASAYPLTEASTMASSLKRQPCPRQHGQLLTGAVDKHLTDAVCTMFVIK